MVFLLFKLETLKDLLANRRIPGEVRKAIKEPLNIRPAVINLVNMPEDTPIEEVVCFEYSF